MSILRLAKIVSFNNFTNEPIVTQSISETHKLASTISMNALWNITKNEITHTPKNSEVKGSSSKGKQKIEN